MIDNPARNYIRKKGKVRVISSCKDSKAKFILGKIAKNGENGTPHKRDEEDRVKYQAVVERYFKFKDNLLNTSKAAQEESKRNRSRAESDRPTKRRKIRDNSRTIERYNH